MTDIFGPEGDEIARQLKLILDLDDRKRRRYVTADQRCTTCRMQLWQIIELADYRVLCTRQIEPGDKPPYRVRLDPRWSFALITDNPPEPGALLSTACRCGWTDLQLVDVLARVTLRNSGKLR